MADVLTEAGVTHSSEFAWSWDDWPAWPAGSRVLQVPIHPVCLGVALEAASAQPADRRRAPAAVADRVAEHFCEAVADGRATGEPVFLYGHPDRRLGRFPHVLRAALAAADQPDIWSTNHSQFAGWWRARAAAHCRVERDGAALCIKVEQDAGHWPLAVEIFHGESVANVPLDRTQTLVHRASLAFEVRPARRLPRGTPVRIRSPWRARLRQAIDWERVTPLEEIPRRHWRGWVKRSLRRVRG
jgi:hypothetical protein